jgi:dTDP-4-amino-4,6-dideoxygalactose transaminase
MSEPRPIPLSEPNIGGNARKYLDECLTTNFVSSVGPFVERFEKEFAAYVGSKYAVACASGTAALHVAFRLLELQPGDEVIVPSLTFIASVNPIVYERGTPVLVDSERESWNYDSNLIVEELERRARQGKKQPRAVEAVHILGHPGKIDELHEACERHGVALIEDASEALGARWSEGRFAGRHVGSAGKISCWSFNGNKIITTGGGGMITTDDAALARRAKHLTTQARLPGYEYRHDEVGYNYRLTNLAAALGVAQLEQLPEFLAKKRGIADRYDTAWQSLRGIIAPPRASWALPSLWLYTVAVDEKTYGCSGRALLERLSAARIQTRPIWSPLHTMPMYRDAPRLGGQVAESLFASGLSLPCSTSLDRESQERVIAAIGQSV